MGHLMLGGMAALFLVWSVQAAIRLYGLRMRLAECRENGSCNFRLGGWRSRQCQISTDGGGGPGSHQGMRHSISGGCQEARFLPV